MLTFLKACFVHRIGVSRSMIGTIRATRSMRAGGGPICPQATGAFASG
jgi:hypothetical protein